MMNKMVSLLTFILNLQKKKRNPSEDELLVAYKKILLSSNFSLEVGASYLFCPSPVQIQSSLFPQRQTLTLTENKSNNNKSIQLTKDSQRRTKRLQRVGLDVPNKRQKLNQNNNVTTTENSISENQQYLNLWVPTASLFPQWSHLHIPTDHEDNPRKISGLSEIHCMVSSIRPVLLA